MSGYFLHVGASVMCSHGGQAQATSSNSRVKVSSQAVVTQTDSYSVSGCPYVQGTVPSPCVNAQWVSAATRVKAGGLPVLLKDSSSVSIPNGTSLNITSTQTRVKGT